MTGRSSSTSRTDTSPWARRSRSAEGGSSSVSQMRLPGASLSREQSPVMPVPIALKETLGVVLVLLPEELTKARVACLHLPGRRVTTVREVEASRAADRHVNEAAASGGRMLLAHRTVLRVDVEDN